MPLRSDNGNKYITNELEDFVRKNEFSIMLTLSTPQQNGVAERKNRALIESAKCMLLDGGLHKRFSGERLDCGVSA